jgi:uncharacterized protein (DUF488 family)
MTQKITLEVNDRLLDRAGRIAEQTGSTAEDVLALWLERYVAAYFFTLYTIGHSDLAAEDFLHLLRQHNIYVVLDVRSAPYSKYVPHFNKRDLEAFLHRNGVDYRYAGDHLGGRPRQTDVYKDGEIPDKDTKREEFLDLVQYEEIMQRNWYQAAVQRLLEVVHETAQKGGNVAIMCGAGNPRECHRHHLIVRSLIDPKLRIVDTDVETIHILKDGTLEIVSPSEFKDLPKQIQLL